MENGKMSLKTVLTELSQAIQSQASVSGPLTLRQMTAAVKNITSSSSALKFYRCAEYSPGSQTINVESGLATLADGSKISLTGEYQYSNTYCWYCPATTASGEYLSAEVTLTAIMMSSSNGTYCYLEFIQPEDINQNIAKSQTVSDLKEIAYTEDAVFTAGEDVTLEQDIVLSGDTSSFCDVFSGYEIIPDSGITWKESTVLTKGLIPKGYIPTAGKIYSYNTYFAVNSIYPATPENIIKFYECSSVDPGTEEELRYPHLISLSGWSEAQTTSANDGYGIYYPEDLSVDQTLRVYSRKDGAFQLKIKNINGSAGQIAVCDASDNIIAATPFMELSDIWNTWEEESYCQLYYPEEAETAWEDGAMPKFFGNIVEWGNGNMFNITNAGSSSINGLYVRGSGCNEFFSAGCYESWINDNGAAAIYWVSDWNMDEDGNEIFTLLLKSSNSLYELLVTDDWVWNTDITSASQFAGYTWNVTGGTAPVPVLSDAEPEKTTSSAGATWSGYEMIRYLPGYAWEVTNAPIEDCNGIYTVYKFNSDKKYIVYSNGKNYLYTAYSTHGYLWAIYDTPTPSLGSQRFYHSELFDFDQYLTPAEVEWYMDKSGNFISVTTAPDGWIKSSILKENMPIDFITPQVGEIYSEDTSIKIGEMYRTN